MTTNLRLFLSYSPSVMLLYLVGFLVLFPLYTAESDSNAEISFADTRRGGIESSEDVQDHASRHIDVVEENPLPNMTPIRARRAHDELTTVTVDEQVVTEATLQRVKRKTGGRKALKHKKTKVNKGTAKNP